MKNLWRYIILAIVAISPFHAIAVDEEPHDTVYFYNTWEEIFFEKPAIGLVDPYIYLLTPYQIAVETGSDDVDFAINKRHIAATLGDSIWLINSQYLKRDFKGDTKKLSDFMPFFFSDRVAYVMYVGENENLNWKNIIFGDRMEIDFDDIVDYYYIDFQNKEVIKITPSSLSELLEDYHDLQMRYEGMKDYKKRDIMMDYFFKYIDRAQQDCMKPYILDVMTP